MPRYGTSWAAQHEWLVVGLHDFHAFRVEVHIVYVFRVVLRVHVTLLPPRSLLRHAFLYLFYYVLVLGAQLA